MQIKLAKNPYKKILPGDCKRNQGDSGHGKKTWKETGKSWGGGISDLKNKIKSIKKKS